MGLGAGEEGLTTEELAVGTLAVGAPGNEGSATAEQPDSSTADAVTPSSALSATRMIPQKVRTLDGALKRTVVCATV